MTGPALPGTLAVIAPYPARDGYAAACGLPLVEDSAAGAAVALVATVLLVRLSARRLFVRGCCHCGRYV